jgi:hypothetical protein
VERIHAAGEPAGFPPSLVRRLADAYGERTIVEGLDDDLRACHEAGRLPRELGLAWAKGG